MGTKPTEQKKEAARSVIDYVQEINSSCFSYSLLYPAEAIKIDIGFTNPLQIPILISNVSLICKYFISSDEMESGKEICILWVLCRTFFYLQHKLVEFWYRCR